MRPNPSDAENEQAPVLEWLERHLGDTSGAPVKRVDTQGAVVLLSGQDAWKLRRAIRLPFLDYSTPEKRREASEAEIRLNRDAAPGIYRDAVPITRNGEHLELGGAGEPIDWITRMQRFDEDATLDRLAERGELSTGLMDRLAREVLASHERAERKDAAAALVELERWIGQNRAAFAEHDDLFPADKADRLDQSALRALGDLRPLLMERGAAGFCRRGHGDLHLRNIAVIDGEPAPFDALEFDDRVATGDVLYDLAFAVMDLWERQCGAAANALLNGYLSRGPEEHYAGLAALPLFLSVRSAIRAKVEAASRSHLYGDARAGAERAARRYFEFALTFLEPRPARLVAVGGLSGSGKSALARTLAPDLGRAPGAVWLSSDIERKHMLGHEPEEPLPASAYDKETTARVYERVRRRAALALGAGQSALIDATHSTGSARRDSAALAGELRAPFLGFWLDAPLYLRKQRVAARRGDASDADVEIVAAQRADPLTEPGWVSLDAASPVDAVADRARAALGNLA